MLALTHREVFQLFDLFCFPFSHLFQLSCILGPHNIHTGCGGVFIAATYGEKILYYGTNMTGPCAHKSKVDAKETKASSVLS